MPYPLQFFDIEVITEAPKSSELLVTVGGNGQPNDVRVVMAAMESADATYHLETPLGWSNLISETVTDPALARGVWYKRLTDADNDFKFSFRADKPVDNCSIMIVTIRNAHPTTPLTVQGNNTVSGGALTMSSLTVPGPGSVLFWAYLTAAGVTLPSGYTSLSATDNTGPNYDSASTAPSVLLAGKNYAASGSTGSVVANYDTTATSSAYAGVALIWVPQAPDVTTSVGTATAVASAANTIVPTVQSQVSFPVGTASTEVDAAGRWFSPLSALRISEPTVLPGTPVTGSIVRWSGRTFASGSSIVVETSIDGGQTWDIATNNAPVPRLAPGNTTADTVMSRVWFSRASRFDPSPRLASLEVQVACDSGRDEYTPLGTFVITNTEMVTVGGSSGGGSGGGGGDGVTGAGGGNTGGGEYLTISGVDLSRQISRNTWNDVYYVKTGTNYGTAIREIVDNRLPGCQFNFASTEHTTPLLMFGTQQGSDPWADCQDLAAAIGYEVFFDARGICTFQPVPDPNLGDPLWKVDDGAEPTVVSVHRALTDESTYNYVVAQGESTANAVPVSAVASDNDPASATYVNGPYGTVSTYFTSAAITTEAQAQAAADAILRNVKGASETVDITMVPMPALEPGDVIAINVDGTKASGNYLINQVTTPLSAAEAQTLNCFRQK